MKTRARAHFGRVAALLLTAGLLTAGLASAPASAAEGSVEATYLDCNYDADAHTMRPVATIHRYPGADNADRRVSTTMALLDGTTQVDQLSAGELSSDGSFADNGLIELAADTTMPVTPWGGYFGETGRAGAAVLQANHTYKVRVRNFEFSSGEQTLRNFTCRTTEDAPENCRGIRMEQMVFKPDYVKAADLDGFPNDKSMCEALWLPTVDTAAGKGFVPQGLALDGNTAWVTGYRHRDAWKVPADAPLPNKKGERCTVAHVSLAGGTQIGPLLSASAPTPDGQLWCQHGGGAALLDQGLLVVSTKNLWLLDPSKTGSAAYVRHWDLAGFNGSFLVDSVDGRLGIGQFEKAKADKIRMFRTSDVFDPDVTTLTDIVGPPTSTEANSIANAEAVAAAQGADYKPGTTKLFSSASDSGCGYIVRGTTTKYGFGPGAEEIEFTDSGTYLWSVFEASAQDYYDKDHVTPMLARFDTATLTGPDAKGPARGCSFG